MTIYIISGVSRGLGYALIEDILQKEYEKCIVIGLSRNKPELHSRFAQKCEWVKTDFKFPEQVIERLDSVLQKYGPTKICFISNAGDINPIAKIGAFENRQMMDSLSVNIISPSFCVNYLVDNFPGLKKLLLINISSGAATKSIAGWSLYSSAKAYMKMYFDVLAIEHLNEPDSRIVVMQIDPGAMDTDMQEDIRNASIPSEQLERLKGLYKNKSLQKPKKVADEILQSIIKLL
jgi:benzil reductase ((S)-benzoin forming)